MALGNTSTFKPLDWDSVRIPYDSSNTITGTSGTFTASLPGALIDYTMEHDRDWIDASGTPKDQMEAMFKKEMAVKLAEKMIADGHVLFTKQDILHNRTVRYKAYTWVGNKDFIEQRRKYG
jgi:hypothetical protein